MSARKTSRLSPREKLQVAEQVSRDQQYNIGHAAALLATMAREAGIKCIGRRGGDLDMEARWLRVEYLAGLIEGHADALGGGLDKLDGVLNHMSAPDLVVVARGAK